MNLAIATDHSFLRHPSGVYDSYCFDRRFFDDYREVFSSVVVICRMQNGQTLPVGAFKSDGNGVRFLDVRNARGAKWFVMSRYLSNSAVRAAIKWCDAVVVRVPSELGWMTGKIAKQAKKPCMLEIIGDPKEAWQNSGSGLRHRLVAWLEGRRLQNLAGECDAASYVSKHLSDIYPVGENRPYDIISSIRLELEELSRERIFDAIRQLEIVQVGSLTARKRSEDLIRAGRLAANEGFLLKIHFAGDGPERERLEGVCHDLRLEDKVVFHGHIADRQALRKLLDEGDIFVLTSASEGLPRAVLEAMARGLPVLGTNTRGVDEVVRHMDLFPVGDVDALAKLIIGVARDPQRLTAMSSHSTDVARRYTSRILSPRRIALYLHLAKKSTKQ
jgi:glycosyltransferase involved in cell wall biosynthesis